MNLTRTNDKRTIEVSPCLSSAVGDGRSPRRQISVAGKTVTNGADGSFAQDGIAAAKTVMLRFSRDGYADSYACAAVIDDSISHVNVHLSPIAVSTTIDNGVGGIVADPASPASVVLSAGSLVNAATGAPVQGAVTVQLAVIDPAANTANMPGSYMAANGAKIESFGAVLVQLRDSAEIV